MLLIDGSFDYNCFVIPFVPATDAEIQLYENARNMVPFKCTSQDGILILGPKNNFAKGFGLTGTIGYTVYSLIGLSNLIVMGK